MLFRSGVSARCLCPVRHRYRYRIIGAPPRVRPGAAYRGLLYKAMQFEGTEQRADTGSQARVSAAHIARTNALRIP